MVDTCICGKKLPVIKGYKRKTGLCASCNGRRSMPDVARIRLASPRKPFLTKQEKADRKRRLYLPEQLLATRKKLEMLTREAIRLGVEIPHE